MDSTEAKVWKRILRRWKGHAVRVEASMGGVDPGTPDGLLTPRGWGGVWVELKVWPTEVSPIQYAWHVDCDQRGGLCCVLVQVGKDSFWVGKAEEYDGMTERPAGESLQAVLDVIRLAATGRRSRF